MNDRQSFYFNARMTYVIVNVLIIMIASVGCSSKENQKERNRVHDSKNIEQSPVVDKSLLLLIPDDLSESLAQVIQCQGSAFRHGFAYVTYPFDHLEDTDIIWIPEFHIDGMTYPVVERSLNSSEVSTINKIIPKIESIKDDGSYLIRDDYQYIIYLNNVKILTISPQILNFKETPHEINGIVDTIISICGPLYPNFLEIGA